MTADLVAFLREQLDADELTLREANTSPEMVTGIPSSYAQAPVALHIARFADPARVLAEITTKRAIVNAHARPHECIELSNKGDHSVVDGKPWENWEPQHTSDHGPCFVLRTLAAPYSGVDGYRPEWTPDA